MRYIFLIAGFFFIFGCYPSNKVSPNANHKEIVRLLTNELGCFWEERENEGFKSISVESLEAELAEKCIDDGLEYQLKLLSLLNTESIEEVFLCSPNEIWLEVKNNDSYLTLHRIILGYIDGKVQDSLCLFTTKYEVNRINQVGEKWFGADITHFWF